MTALLRVPNLFMCPLPCPLPCFSSPSLGSKEIFSLEHQKCSLPRVTSGHTKGKTENLCHYYMECFQCSEKKEENWHKLASLDNNNEV